MSIHRYPTRFQANQHFIVNLTEGSYFSYSGSHYEDYLRELCYADKRNESRWKKTDTIKFVPDHVKQYVSKNYGKVKF